MLLPTRTPILIQQTPCGTARMPQQCDLAQEVRQSGKNGRRLNRDDDFLTIRRSPQAQTQLVVRQLLTPARYRYFRTETKDRIRGNRSRRVHVGTTITTQAAQTRHGRFHQREINLFTTVYIGSPSVNEHSGSVLLSIHLIKVVYNAPLFLGSMREACSRKRVNDIAMHLQILCDGILID